jgi:hypothetical protein
MKKLLAIAVMLSLIGIGCSGSSTTGEKPAGSDGSKHKKGDTVRPTTDTVTPKGTDTVTPPKGTDTVTPPKGTDTVTPPKGTDGGVKKGTDTVTPPKGTDGAAKVDVPKDKDTPKDTDTPKDKKDVPKDK